MSSPFANAHASQPLSPRKAAGAMAVLADIREMLDDIARSATILGGTPFDGREVARDLAQSLNSTLLEYEMGLAELDQHRFQVKQ